MLDSWGLQKKFCAAPTVTVAAAAGPCPGASPLTATSIQHAGPTPLHTPSRAPRSPTALASGQGATRVAQGACAPCRRLYAAGRAAGGGPAGRRADGLTGRTAGRRSTAGRRADGCQADGGRAGRRGRAGRHGRAGRRRADGMTGWRADGGQPPAGRLPGGRRGRTAGRPDAPGAPGAPGRAATMRGLWLCRQCRQVLEGVFSRLDLYESPYGTVWYLLIHYLYLLSTVINYTTRKHAVNQILAAATQPGIARAYPRRQPAVQTTDSRADRRAPRDAVRPPPGFSRGPEKTLPTEPENGL